MPRFSIDTSALGKIKVPEVKLTAYTENKAALELTTNCGCGGKCLSSTT